MWRDKTLGYFSSNPTIESSELTVGVFRLRVHKHIYHPPDVWLASCVPIYAQRELKCKDLDGAKMEAQQQLKLILEEALLALE